MRDHKLQNDQSNRNKRFINRSEAKALCDLSRYDIGVVKSLVN